MCSSVCDIIATGGGLPCNARGILEMNNRVLTEKAGAFFGWLGVSFGALNKKPFYSLFLTNLQAISALTLTYRINVLNK